MRNFFTSAPMRYVHKVVTTANRLFSIDKIAPSFIDDLYFAGAATDDGIAKAIIDGKEKSISLWVKEGKNGKFFSASFQDPWKPAGEPEKANGYMKDPLPLNEYPEDEIPF